MLGKLLRRLAGKPTDAADVVLPTLADELGKGVCYRRADGVMVMRLRNGPTFTWERGIEIVHDMETGGVHFKLAEPERSRGTWD